MKWRVQNSSQLPLNNFKKKIDSDPAPLTMRGGLWYVYDNDIKDYKQLSGLSCSKDG